MLAACETSKIAFRANGPQWAPGKCEGKKGLREPFVAVSPPCRRARRFSLYNMDRMNAVKKIISLPCVFLLLCCLLRAPALAAGTATVSVDASVVGGGYLVKPTAVPADGERASVVLLRLLAENGYTAFYGGTPENTFYLAYIADGDKTGSYNGYTCAAALYPPRQPKKLAFGTRIAAPLQKYLSENAGYFEPDDYEENSKGYLGEFVYTDISGWMYCLNGSYVQRDLGSVYLQPGDTLRLQFTLCLGADLGGAAPDVQQAYNDAMRENEPATKPPETTAKAPETTTKAPETTTKAPETTTKAPETSSKATETTARAPETTSKAAETTAKPPETTTKAPEATTKAAETTAKAPETATEAPQTTASAPETTTLPAADGTTAAAETEAAVSPGGETAREPAVTEEDPSGAPEAPAKKSPSPMIITVISAAAAAAAAAVTIIVIRKKKESITK